MIKAMPDFIDSPYLIIDEKGWRLKEDAPDDLIKRFEEYMNSLSMVSESG